MGCKSLSSVESVSAASLSIRATSRLADGPERFSGRVAFAAERRRITPEPIIRPRPNLQHSCSTYCLSCLDPTQVAALACERCFGGADMGIIMVRFVRLRFAAVAMIAAAIIAATTASGWAFSQQTISPDANGNYNFNYTDPKHPATTSQSAHPSESNNLGFHFSVEHGQTGPFGGFQSGNNFFGNSGNDRPPELTPLGNNGN
jgi:hypothetical protein